MERIGSTAGPQKLVELSARPDAVFVAFEPTGAASVEPHPDLVAMFSTVWLVDSPMDPLEPASIPTAVALFDAARRRGAASGIVRVKAMPEVDLRLHVFDLTEQYGCFGGVVVPAAADEDAEGTDKDLAPVTPKYMVVHLDVHGVVTAIDAATTAALGWEPSEVVGRSTLDFIHPEDHERGIALWVDLLGTEGSVRRIRQRFLRRDGWPVWMEVTETNRIASDGHVVLELIDITHEMAALEALRQREELLRQLADALPSGVMQVDVNGDIEFSNRRWYEILGITQDAPPEALLDMVDSATRQAIEVRMAAVRDTGLPAEIDIAVTSPVGDDLTCRLLLRHLEESRQGSVLVTLEDITERHRLQRRLVAQAAEDPLTGLLNRSAIMRHLEGCLGEDPGLLTGVLFVDLDGFKLVNDTLGHAVGDRLLCDVARVITERVRDVDRVGRLGGDEFVVVAPNLPDESLAVDLGVRICEAVADLSTTHNTVVSASVGCAVSIEHENAEALLAAADAAMYEQKRRKRIKALA